MEVGKGSILTLEVSGMFRLPKAERAKNTALPRIHLFLISRTKCTTLIYISYDHRRRGDLEVQEVLVRSQYINNTCWPVSIHAFATWNYTAAGIVECFVFFSFFRGRNNFKNIQYVPAGYTKINQLFVYIHIYIPAGMYTIVCRRHYCTLQYITLQPADVTSAHCNI